jgi:cytochrome c oxidase assembly protein subunit 15
MSSDACAVPAPAPAVPPRGATSTVFRLAALFTFLAVAMGAVVCSTGSGAGCPTWPGCHPDTIAPQWQLSPMIEFAHRVAAIGAGPLVLAAAVMALRLPGADLWVRLLPWVALTGAMAAGAFGRLVVLSGLPTWAGAIDLVAALTAMTVMGIAAVRLAARPQMPSAGGMLPAWTLPMARSRAGRPWQLPAAGVVVLIGMQVMGLFTAGNGSFTRCLGWPMWQLVEGDRYRGLQALRLGTATLAAALVIGTVMVSLRQERLRRWGIGIGVLFAVEMLLGLEIRDGGFTMAVAAAYSVVAVALLWGLGLLTAVARVERVTADGAPLQPAAV